MGKIIRRGEVVSVQARRVGEMPPQPVPPPSTVYVPGPADVPPTAAGGPQNVIYVVAPQAAPAGPPTVVHHHHHHTTQVVLPPVRRRRPAKGTSFLGTLGFVLGLLACGMAAVPQVAAYGVYVAMGGLVAAALAWVGAVLLRRVGATMPFVGIVVSAVGYAAGLYNTGRAQATYDMIRSRSPVPLPAVHFPAPSGPAAPADPLPAPAATSPSHPTVIPQQKRFGEGTIFDMQPAAGVKPATRP